MGQPLIRFLDFARNDKSRIGGMDKSRIGGMDKSRIGGMDKSRIAGEMKIFRGMPD